MTLIETKHSYIQKVGYNEKSKLLRVVYRTSYLMIIDYYKVGKEVFDVIMERINANDNDGLYSFFAFRVWNDYKKHEHAKRRDASEIETLIAPILSGQRSIYASSHGYSNGIVGVPGNLYSRYYTASSIPRESSQHTTTNTDGITDDNNSVMYFDYRSTLEGYMEAIRGNNRNGL
jgi:hypothetical protein